MGIKTKFSAYLPLPDATKSAILDTGVVVFDANVLLGLYQYAPVTRREVIQLLKKRLQGRAWIPHQVAVEYLRHRLQYINEDRARINTSQQVLNKSFDAVSLAIQNVEFEKIGSKLDLSPIQNALDEAKTKLLDELKRVGAGYPDLAAKDEVLDFVDGLFEGQIGEPFANQAELDNLYAEGQKRYDAGKPPGFRDAHKEDSAYIDGGLQYKNKFSDFVIWTQLLRQIAADPKRFSKIAFVTRERKDDWWITDQGKVLGPRVELRQELEQAGVKEFHMYSMAQFIEMLQQRTPKDQKPAVSSESLKEVQSVEQSANWIRLGDLLRAKRGEHALTSTYQDLLRDVAYTAADGYQGFLSQVAVRNWLAFRHPADEIVENQEFPDLLVLPKQGMLSPSLELRGYEVITPRNPGHLVALLKRNISRAERFLAEATAKSPRVSLTFVVTLNVQAILPIGLDEWVRIVSSERTALSAKTQIALVLGVLDRDTFKELEPSSI